MDNEQLIGDVVASIVEKVLMNIGLETCNKVSQILTDHNLTFSDCYQNPDVLNFALKEMFGNAYMVIVEKIRIELSSLDDNRLVVFVQKLSK